MGKDEKMGRLVVSFLPSFFCNRELSFLSLLTHVCHIFKGFCFLLQYCAFSAKEKDEQVQEKDLLSKDMNPGSYPPMIGYDIVVLDYLDGIIFNNA
jgi:hypothetical protein